MTALASADQRVAMLLQVLTTSVDVFKENSRVLTVIESKAQNAATVAGIFLAAAFSFLRKETLTNLYEAQGWFGLVLLCVSIGFMLSTVLLCAYTIKATEMLSPPDPAEILARVDLRLNAGPEGPTETQRENNLREQAWSWNTALKAQGVAIATKSKLLVWTQTALITGISVVVAFLLISIYAYGRAGSAQVN